MIALVLVVVGIVVIRINPLLLQLSPTDTSNLPLNNDPSFSLCLSKRTKEIQFSDVIHNSRQ